MSLHAHTARPLRRPGRAPAVRWRRDIVMALRALHIGVELLLSFVPGARYVGRT